MSSPPPTPSKDAPNPAALAIPATPATPSPGTTDSTTPTPLAPTPAPGVGVLVDVPQHAVEDPGDVKVTELHTMFPSVEKSVIGIILESCGGSQDRAIEQLLSMTDENFKPDELVHVRQEEANQLDLDAEFARSLQIQEDEDSRRAMAAPPNQLPYQPRIRHRQQPAQEPQPRQSQEGMHDRYGSAGVTLLFELLSADTLVGKQTFSSLLNKAKGAFSDFQARQAQQKEMAAQSTSWGAQRAQGDIYRQPSAPGGGRGGDQNRSRGLWNDSASYSSRSESFSSDGTELPQPQPRQAQPVLHQSAARWQPSDAYDDPLPPNRTLSGNRIEVTPGRRSPASGPSPPPKGTIDPAKLGILPKKRVDLLSTSPPVGSAGAKGKTPLDDDDDDPNPSLPSAPLSALDKIPKTPPASSSHRLRDSDELDYVPNPFDER
ncbi:hypothetical protein TREMEDRAFT_68867 [Tremella mesenterica DSM 1558]|uniref:uncharacterized protein n=1 Tax=Tremella mesenterica (strain ATCC 24925 / CBS 8224 / DSM 1558 / NBRC 9311 / NRRL Y-6157 / RJB 2259-6 / UBC 559-6) TaxID=578456 RepID=UPI0003F4A578|nr:uncharacterized protein TREMEDRAFT_68867 [Tremella mesenterica DSM 1558]EIW68928.1 hypothetical protein TREMEDRAFT_68867 [Tremella mesenterica DSM 1558]